MNQERQPKKIQASDAPRDALNWLIAQQPQRHPLVFGFVGAIGTPWDLIFRHFEESLQRFDYATSKIHLAEAERLILRDQSDPQNRDYGQNVRDTFALADIFVPGTSGIDISLPIDRFLDSVFGAPFLTPTQHEEGMRFAEVAALRSAATGRQVGAALIPVSGTPVVAGTNEVPKPGGGQFWTSDSPDYRDFKIGRDPNKVHIKWVVQDFFERLSRNGWLSEKLKDKTGQELADLAFESDGSGSSVLKDARVTDLIEFARCLHAEQATIINAARSGVVTQDAVLYTTTFPCHECAKMVIGAGIAEVHYVAPYPKSLVSSIFRELIDVCPRVETSGGSGEEKIPFRQFLGIAPRWYEHAFVAGERREGDQLITFDRRSASPKASGWSQAGVEERESSTNTAISRMFEQLVRDSVAAKEDDSRTKDSSTHNTSRLEA